MIQIDVFDYFAFLVIAVLLAVAVVMIVTLGGLPGKIAASRNHPDAEAVTAAGWISFVTLGALWPLAFVWAFLPLRGCSQAGNSQPSGGVPAK